MLARTTVICTTLTLLASSRLAIAAITRVEPFVGQMQESWEVFDTYRSQEDPTDDFFLVDPTPIFAGRAFISQSKIGIYEVNTGAGYDLISSGVAQVADGFKGLGLASNSPQVLPRYVEPASITFAKQLTAFGGYWGAATDYLFDPEVIEFEFFDAAGNLVGVDERPYTRSFLIDESAMIYFGDGELLWTGWQFDVPVQRIVFGGGFIVADYLQANTIPEPSTAALVLFGGCLVFVFSRRTRLRQ